LLYGIAAAFVVMMSSAAALLANTKAMAAVETASKKLPPRRDLFGRAVAALAARPHANGPFNRMGTRLGMAAFLRVTIVSVTTAEARPERAPRTLEG
jgi:hypothetical protein